MINKESLINFFKLLNQKAKDHHDDFNSLDGQLGDGDLGITLTNGIEEIYNNRFTFVNFGSSIQYIDKYEEVLDKITDNSKQFYSKNINFTFNQHIFLTYGNYLVHKCI